MVRAEDRRRSPINPESQFDQYTHFRLGHYFSDDDKDFELDCHLRHSALPRPGRIRELLGLVSRLHGTLMDRMRPLWEINVIEGLSDGRVALFMKVIVTGCAFRGLRSEANSLVERPVGLASSRPLLLVAFGAFGAVGDEVHADEAA